ncbi:LysR family transcriptional regulator [Klebsiella variicola subsp. variicola]|nr:LysR family transcriptional regulator [Klebsiella variicola subsp. variicola]
MKRQERIDRIELMRTYIRIIEAGSLSAAAGQMDTTQATVSRRLQSLEGLLGGEVDPAHHSCDEAH